MATFTAIQRAVDGGEIVVAVGTSAFGVYREAQEHLVSVYIEQNATMEQQDAVCDLLSDGIDVDYAMRVVLGVEFKRRTERFVKTEIRSITIIRDGDEHDLT